MATLRKLDLLWLHSNCPARVTIITLDAAIRPKLLYWLESAQLGEAELRKLDLIHLKTMRKILGYTTTYVNRENTNSKIYKDILKNREGRKRYAHLGKHARNQGNKDS